MSVNSLADKIEQFPSVLEMLRNANIGFYVFPMVSEHSNWREEQMAWANGAVLFDQSYHMTDVYVEGPDTLRLLEDISINKWDGFGPLQAKQIVTVSAEGYLVADAICIGLEHNKVALIGKPTTGNYANYIADKGDYDVSVTRSSRALDRGEREHFRFQIQGPNAYEIMAKVIGQPLPKMRFFGMSQFAIDGVQVTALRHGMADAPGIEFFGRFSEKEKVRNAVVAAGEGLGLKEGGARTYSTAMVQSGWVGAIMHAIWGDDLQGFREWLPATSFEANFSLGGSFMSDNVNDYQMDPWDLGYHRLIDWERDFPGRDALLAKKDQPHRKKVSLHWHPDDVLKVWGSLFHDGDRYKHIELPAAQYATLPYDQIMLDGEKFGLSIYAAYNASLGKMMSIGLIPEDEVAYGKEVTIIWGEENGGSRKPTVEPHVQTTIRATMAPLGQGLIRKNPN